jgi:hypothetical protein
MDRRRAVNGQCLKVCKAQLVQMVLMVKMEVKEKLLQRHQMLQDLLVRKVYKEKKEIKVNQAQAVQMVLQAQLDQRVQQVRKVQLEVLVVDQQAQPVRPALPVQQELQVHLDQLV